MAPESHGDAGLPGGRGDAGDVRAMRDALILHRLQFAFTIIFHPVLTVGLALLITVMKGMGLRPGEEGRNDAA